MTVILDPVIPSGSVIDCTTLARVKSFLEIVNDTQYDTFIDAAIDAVSKQFELYLGRGIAKIDRVEYFDVAPGQVAFQVYAWPIASISEIKNDSLHEFGSGTIVDSSLYTAYGNDGTVFADRLYLADGPISLKISYNGGLAVDTTALIAAFPDIAGAADMQVAFIDKRRRSVEAVNAGAGGTNVTFSEFELLPDVKARLDRYRRVYVGG